MQRCWALLHRQRPLPLAQLRSRQPLPRSVGCPALAPVSHIPPGAGAGPATDVLSYLPL